MKLTCLMPTYGRPRHLLANAIACFEMQDYPIELSKLLILDDGGSLPTGLAVSQNVVIVGMDKRCSSLPMKYDILWQTTDSDAFVVWDDDDIYLPWHLSSHASALRDRGWSHPREVWSTYTGQPKIESAAGRFHGSLAVRRDLLERVGGWLGVMPEGHPKRADFDQRLISALAAIERRGDPVDYLGSPSYVFRWGGTQAGHCQGLMRSPDDETWYDNVTPPSGEVFHDLRPHLDADCERVFRVLLREYGDIGDDCFATAGRGDRRPQLDV